MNTGPRGGCLLPFGLILFLLLAACTGSRVQAQSPVVTQPYVDVITTNSSSTVAVTNTFQSIFAAPTGNQKRAACTVQNTGTNSMYVFFGAIADATTAKSIKLAAGNAVTCNNSGVTLQEQVSITGTATETFYAAQQ